MSLSESIRAVWSIDPSAPAVEFEGRWHSWGELAELGTALDAELTRAGIGSNAAVGVLLRNGPGTVGALLGLLATQRCVVTLNPIQGAERLAGEVRRLRLPALVGAAREWRIDPLRSAAAEAGSLGLELTGDSGDPLRRVAGLDEPGAGPHHDPMPGVAVEMLTSGTTGPPKRIALLYASLDQSITGALHYERRDASAPLALRSGTAIVNAPLVHVSGLWRSLLNLAQGRKIVLMERFRLDAWLEIVRRHRPRTASLVPAALKMVLDANVDPADLSSLKAIVCGTAPLPLERQIEFQKLYGIPVLVSYGATEFAGGVAGWTLPDHREWWERKQGSAGRAHPGTQLRVVDPESFQPLPAGETGLLEVRSSQLGSDEWVRTTDVATLDADEFLWIHGRSDAAILRGGFKIEPAEVAEAIERHPAVREVSVVGLPDERLGQVPVAAVVLDPAAAPVAPESLLEFARERLAGYQVPTRLRIVSALPRTPSLKVSQPEVRALFE
ncbi:MAG: long-chain fatty acid--CoA ligase [Proteobacteria bacterium]|nr:long-chain fatty acid--CoA ligase [Pseudomonadota bacterium]